MKRVRLDKKDSFRILLTDTAPGDSPIIFSNDGLYINSHSHQLGHNSTDNKIFKLFHEKLFRAGPSQSSPYKYSVRKSNFSLRTLSLIHPRAQFNFAEFYAKHSDAIIYLCSLSKASIRSPYKVSNSYYRSNSDKSSKYKEVDIDTLENELSRKHSSSYFSYRGHNRLYKLFDSNEYISLEKKFSSLWMLDVANCFDSIYTHTISWAIKNKEYVKSKTDYKNQFCDEFDRLMQRSNNNETNGIPIGSEVSRIFSEIIFQSIDCNIMKTISNTFGYKYDEDYIFRRYVDDYIVFSKSDEISSHVSKAISDGLADYNLYINEGKLKTYERPFTTEKSDIIGQVKIKIGELEDKILEKATNDGKRLVKPKKINRKDSVIKYFISQIKHLCKVGSRDYSDISSYLISTLSNRIIELTETYEQITDELEDEVKLRYRDAIITMTRLIFFFYTVSPQVASSYKLAKIVIIIDKFFILKCPEFSDHFRTLVMSEVGDIPLSSGSDGERSGFVSLEGLNVLLATSEFGLNYLVPEERLNVFFSDSARPSYFSLMSLLFYIKNYEKYSEIKITIENEILKKMEGYNKIPKK